MTCYKNSEKPACIDLILTNQPTFQHSIFPETGLSGLLRLDSIITYQNYMDYDNDAFRSEIKSFCSLNEPNLGLFKGSVFYIFNKHARIRKEYLRANLL